MVGAEHGGFSNRIVQLDKRLKKILEKAIVELRDNIIKELLRKQSRY